jgi:hypothetical protein
LTAGDQILLDLARATDETVDRDDLGARQARADARKA